MDRRVLAAVGMTVGIFLVVQLGALALVEPFEAAGYQTVEDPTNPVNSLVYVGAILVATALMLLAIKFDLQWVMRGFVLLATASVTYYVFTILVPQVFSLGGANGLAVVAALAVTAGLWFYPEWYVIDAAGVVMGMGAAGLFGISFGLLPALILLVVLAVYDAISVYGTEHMLTLASGVMKLKLPVVLIVPLSRSYSFLEQVERAGEGTESGDGETEPGSTTEDNDGTTAEARAGADETEAVAGETEGVAGESETVAGETEAVAREAEVGDGGPLERGALFIGLGDAVMPTILVASAGFFLEVPRLVPGLALTLPSLGAMAGTFLGLFGLLWLVMKGRAHAGLPLLNGGAIVGYLVGATAAGVPLTSALGL